MFVRFTFSVSLLAAAFAQLPDCPPLTDTPIPNDVSLLDVTHLRAIGLLGDSIGAGFAITGLPVESAGQVYAIGGDDGVPSSAALLRNQNPRIVGLSEDGARGLNVAVSGGVVADMPGQAERFVEAVANRTDVDFENDWKMVTIWIGGNNICAACNGGAAHTPEQYERDLDAALRIMYDRVPRLVVNLVSQFNFSSMYDATSGLTRCFLNRLLCSCVMTGSAAERAQMDVLAQDYNRVMQDLTAVYNSSPREDFGVIFQKMGIDSRIPSVDYLSVLDCFHPNRLAHDVIGINGFNELFKTPAERSTLIDFDDPQPVCATDAAKRIFIG